jgi:hypothetical protein
VFSAGTARTAVAVTDAVLVTKTRAPLAAAVLRRSTAREAVAVTLGLTMMMIKAAAFAGPVLRSGSARAPVAVSFGCALAGAAACASTGTTAV